MVFLYYFFLWFILFMPFPVVISGIFLFSCYVWIAIFSRVAFEILQALQWKFLLMCIIVAFPFFIDRVVGEIMNLVTSVWPFVCLFVCLFACALLASWSVWPLSLILPALQVKNLLVWLVPNLAHAVSQLLRGNVGENQTDPPTCRHNLCSYSGYQKYSWIQGVDKVPTSNRSGQTMSIGCVGKLGVSLVFSSSDITYNLLSEFESMYIASGSQGDVWFFWTS